MPTSSQLPPAWSPSSKLYWYSQYSPVAHWPPAASFVIVAQMCHHLAPPPAPVGSFPANFLCGSPAFSQGKPNYPYIPAAPYTYMIDPTSPSFLLLHCIILNPRSLLISLSHGFPQLTCLLASIQILLDLHHPLDPTFTLYAMIGNPLVFWCSLRYLVSKLATSCHCIPTPPGDYSPPSNCILPCHCHPYFVYAAL
jgi:hypothetical protein